ADDYMTKPFSMRELVARTKALLRRQQRASQAAELSTVHQPEPPLVVGDVTVDRAQRRVLRGADEVHLTPTEFDLLATLLSEPRRVWQRDTLLRRVWGSEWGGDGHLVEVHMGNLRRKLGDDSRNARYIRTVRGVGYRMEGGAT
ncbi:MAG: response regulator transcription factor, partial [Actinobacteria bacterium]|nr:response regulator transcription factor [Actinomycetota bacterium]